MCGRYSQTCDANVLAQRFGANASQVGLAPQYNIAPTNRAPVLIEESGRQLKFMQWGLVPSWAKDTVIGSRMINARAETVAEKPSFRKLLERRRCLVLADSFYEWRKVDDTKTKIPMRFVLKSREPFAFAGLWDTWKKPDGNELQSFTIITTEANDLIRPVHDRMPVILKQEDEEKWLDPDITDSSKLTALLGPLQSDVMAAYQVSALINSPKNDVAKCIEPVSQSITCG